MKKLIFGFIMILSFVFTWRLEEVNCNAATYHITHTVKLAWRASCNVNTSGTSIQAINNVQVNTSTGHVVRKYLTKDSRNQYTLHIVQKIGVVTSTYGLRIKYLNHKMIVTII